MFAPRSMQTVRTLIAAALAAAVGGCFYPAERGRAIEARMERLESDNHALREELDKTKADLDAQLPKIDAKIAEVSKALTDLDKAARRSGADTSVQVQKNVEDLAELRGQMELYLHQLEELRGQLQTAQADTEQKMLQMMSPEQAKAYQDRKKLEALERPADPKAFLALADQKARAGDTGVARNLYDEFLRKWPRHELAGEAEFGLGELWYKNDKCREALGAYGKVIQEYPNTKSAPEAYLRSSDCFGKLNMHDEAKLALEEVVKNHPKSAAAKTAKAKLASQSKSSSSSKKSKRGSK